ncbi:MAG: glycosyltransferase family 2 protein [Phycisphaerales bacterium]|nr:glycosyltransferase family 2 protein [Planctomycetota bacterium]
MPPVSISIVCKNNKGTLGRVLDAVAPIVAGEGPAAGEVVAVDSGSQDGTIELLERHKARVISSPWLGYIKTKQLALDSCSRPWVLCLDSDEPPEPDLVRSIVRAVELNDPHISGYRVNRKLYFAGRFLDHCWQPERRLRLVRRGFAKWAGIEPHDKLELLPGAGEERDLEGTLRHDSFSSFSQHLARQAVYARVAADALFERGERSTAFTVSTTGILAFLKQMLVKQAWRDGWRGVLGATSSAAGTLMKHIVLYELTMREHEEKQRLPSAEQKQTSEFT